VSCDSFVVAGYTDHIIPWDGAYRTTQLLGGDSEFVLSTGGHIQAILNPPGNAKSSYLVSDSLPATAAEWRDSATQESGSWWSRWHEWLAARSGGLRDARPGAGNAAHPPLEAAPGRYVHL
jgi:polyhydroxyalkanoate synthase